MNKKILISIILLIFLLVGCNKESINENISNSKEEISESTEKNEEIEKETPQEEYEIIGYWISRDELSTVKVYKEKDKIFFNLNSIRVKKFSRCTLSEDLIEFPGDGIDFIEYKIENDTLRFIYQQESFVFIRASENDFNKTNEKISKYLDSQDKPFQDSETPIKEILYGYWIAPNEKVAMILNQTGIADITTKSNSIGENFRLDEEFITFERLGTYKIELALDNKTMQLIQNDEICFTFTKYTSLDAFFQAKNNIFNNISNPLDEIEVEFNDEKIETPNIETNEEIGASIGLNNINNTGEIGFTAEIKDTPNNRFPE